MRLTLLSCLVFFGSWLCLAAAEPEKSVVQVITFSQEPVWQAPWRSKPVDKQTGSGFVIPGKRIMTNAHVVSWARQILLRRYQDPHPYLARVTYIGHDCDLALLEVADPEFFEGMEPLTFGELPAVRSTVVNYGYPMGGEQISYTRGVVSRIEIQNYVHIGNRAMLGVQTDAAINPGNSGGPVIQDDQVVGVAFQGISSLENTGFFIPPPVIRHFLADIADERYDGFPQAGIRLAPLQSRAYREYLGLPPGLKARGARIDSILEVETTKKVLREDDVVLQVGAYEVGSDATILFQGNRIGVAQAFQEPQHGEFVSVKILRNGNEMDLSLPVYVEDSDRATGNQHDIKPGYFIYGGLVFTPLSLDLLKSLEQNWNDAVNAEIVYELFYHRYEDPESTREEPVLLVDTLAHPVNANVGIKKQALVDTINGRRIESLEDVVRAFETNENAQHIIEFLPNHSFECLNRAAADAATPAILESYNISSDRRL